MADLLLSVDLDPKDAIQTAKNLKKEVDKVMTAGRSTGSNKPSGASPINTAAIDKAKAKMAELEVKMQDAATKQQALVKQLEQMQTVEVPTKEYSDLEDEFDRLNKQLADLQEKMKWDEETGGELYFHSSQFEEDLDKADDLADRINKIDEELAEMEKSGKNVIDPTTTEEYQKVLASLEAVNAKMNQLNIQHRQAEDKINGADKAMKVLGKDTANVQKAVKVMASSPAGFAGFGKAIGTALKGLKRIILAITAITLGVRGVMGIVNKLRSAIREGFQYLEESDKKFKKQMTELKDSFKELKANLAAAFMPIIEIAIPYIQKLIDWINMLISKLAMFVAAIAGQNAYTRAIKKTGDAAAGASKQLSKFDELNNLTTNGGSDWSTEQLPIDQKVLDFAERLKAALAEIKQLFKELVAEPFMEGFKEAIGDWQSKVNTIKMNLQDIGRHIIDIFSSEDLQVAMKDYVGSFSKFLGALTGLFANIGLNIGMAVTGGIEKFLAEHKTEIQEDLIDMFTIGSDIFDNFSQLAIDLSNIVDVIGESESLQSTISNLLGTVYELYSAITLVILKLTDLVSGTIADAIHNNVDNIKQSLEKLFPVFEKASEFLETVATTIKNIVLRVMDEVVTPAFEAIKPILSDLLAIIIKIQDKLSPFFEYVFEQLTVLWQDYVDPILNDIIDLMRDTMGPIFEMISELWHEYAGPFTDFLLECIDILMPIIIAAFDTVIALFKAAFIIIGQLIKTVKEMVAFINAIINGDWKSAWQHAKQFFKELFVNPAIRLWDLLVDHGRSVCDRLKDFARNLVIGLARLVESLANIVTSGINDVIISAINGLINAANKIPAVNFPTLSPIQNLSFNIPALASGTVIPPSMGEFIAKLGDNKQETEIVSPLSTMKEALMEAMQEMGGSGEYHIHVDVDGREIAKAVVRQNDIYRKSTGKGLLAY